MGARRITSVCTLNTPNINSTKAATVSAEKNVPRAGVSARLRWTMEVYDSTPRDTIRVYQSPVCWGHASSADLVHWEDSPVPMWPHPPYDVDEVYSGNTFIDNDGFPCAKYTANAAGPAEAHGVLARSTAGWLSWHKHNVSDNEQRCLARALGRPGGRRESCGSSSSAVWWEGAAQRRAAHLWTSPDLDPPRYHRRGRRPRAPLVGTALPGHLQCGGRTGRRARGADRRMVGARNNPYWTGSYDRQARRFHPARREPRFVGRGRN